MKLIINYFSFIDIQRKFYLLNKYIIIHENNIIIKDYHNFDISYIYFFMYTLFKICMILY